MSEKSKVGTLATFYDQLEKHDWYYAWSDDGRVYSVGEQENQRLQTLALYGGLAYEQLLRDYHAYMFTGPSFRAGEARASKPARPA